MRNQAQFKTAKQNPVENLAHQIITQILKYRRVANACKACRIDSCLSCPIPHLQKVKSAIKKEQPITFVLPAFPGKSPNRQKVLGPLPEQAERITLMYLNELNLKI